MDNKKLLELLKKKIKADGMSKVAVAMGHRTTSAITQWVYRGSIPFCRVEAVQKYLRGSK